MTEAARLAFYPVDLARRDDFEALFEAPGAPKYCWCMVWRATSQEGRGTSGAIRKGQMLGRIDRGVPVGLIGYLDDLPRAWVSIAPRETYLRLGGAVAGPNEQIWSLACLYLHKSLRGQGIAHQAIAAAADYARTEGATLIEAYPVADDAPSYRFMGFVSAFERAGFAHFGMQGKRRHVMRLALNPVSGPEK